ncbi:MAG: AraC family transcriptional regulator [Acidimicrobiia bacterium]|nr:AraC family transcriptional regulator [Acidimicrobiia bacterium]
MLTIYEQIQESIDFIEANLFEGVTADTAASSACMSVRSFHRYFPALTGHRFGEYVRKRHPSEAMSILMRSDDSVLEIALHQ